MRPIAGSILILAAVQFHQSPFASRLLGRCVLWLIIAAGVWYLTSDLCGERGRQHLGRVWDWVLSGGNFLIKGTLLGAFLGLLASFTLLGPSRIASVVAMPGAFIGLMLGVVVDALAHRRQHRQPVAKSKLGAEADSLADDALADDALADDALANDALANDALADDQRRPLVEAHGWDLSLGASHPVANWPKDSGPFERR